MKPNWNDLALSVRYPTVLPDQIGATGYQMPGNRNCNAAGFSTAGNFGKCSLIAAIALLSHRLKPVQYAHLLIHQLGEAGGHDHGKENHTGALSVAAKGTAIPKRSTVARQARC